MHIARLDITNFRGVRAATLYLPKHAVLVGDNNTGKSTILEAIDLVMGPDRLARRPPVDEHDFFQGKYLVEAAEPHPSAEVPPAPTPTPEITVDVVVIDLSADQQARFAAYIEWWDTAASKLYDDPNPEGVDAAQIVAALRLCFIGYYDVD